MTARRTAGIALALVASMTLVAGTGEAHPGHGSVAVEIAFQAYSPADAEVIVGDSVVWTWTGPDTNHSVTSDPGQADRFDSDPTGTPAHPAGDTFVHTFNEVGTFRYHCRVHPTMTGKVVVTDP